MLVSRDRLEQLIQRCTNLYKGIPNSELQDKRVLDLAVYELLDINPREGDEKVLTIDDTQRIKYFAQLYSVQGELEELKYKFNNKKLKQQKKGEGTQESLQGWYPEDFLPLRIRSLLEIVVRIQTGDYQEKKLPMKDKKHLYEMLYDELWVQIETYWAYQCPLMIDAHPETYQTELYKAHANNITNHLSQLKLGERYVYHSGSEIHTLYVSFQCLPIQDKQTGKTKPSLIVFVYNCGNGVYGRIGLEKRHEIIVIQKNIEKARPCLLGYLPMEALKKENSKAYKALYHYIQGLAESQKEPEDYVLKVMSCSTKNQLSSFIEKKYQKKFLLIYILNEEKWYIYGKDLSNQILNDYVENIPSFKKLNDTLLSKKKYLLNKNEQKELRKTLSNLGYTPYHKVYSKTFKKILRSLTYKELTEQAPQSRTIQLAENCVVYNHCSEMRNALLLRNQSDPHILYYWVINQEAKYIKDTKPKGLKLQVLSPTTPSKITGSTNTPTLPENPKSSSSSGAFPKPSSVPISQKNIFTSISEREEEKEKLNDKDEELSTSYGRQG